MVKDDVPPLAVVFLELLAAGGRSRRHLARVEVADAEKAFRHFRLVGNLRNVSMARRTRKQRPTDAGDVAQGGIGVHGLGKAAFLGEVLEHRPAATGGIALLIRIVIRLLENPAQL